MRTIVLSVIASFFGISFLACSGSSTPVAKPRVDIEETDISVAGEAAQLIMQDQFDVAVAVDEASLTRFIDFFSADDETGVEDMLIEGTLYVVDLNTCVQIIDPGEVMYQVLILQGAHYGEIGWVCAEFVHPVGGEKREYAEMLAREHADLLSRVEEYEAKIEADRAAEASIELSTESTDSPGKTISEIREWLFGEEQINAKLIQVKRSVVTLELEDGARIERPAGDASASDKRYIQNWVRQSRSR